MQASGPACPIDETEAGRYRSRYPIFDRKIYLNSCSLGPLSRDSQRALTDYGQDWSEFGAPAWWLRWIPKIEEIRSLFAAVIGAEMSSVTIHHSISSALTSIGAAIDYGYRNRVVVAEVDFPTIAYQWLARKGVEVVFARSPDGITVPLEEYERLIDERTAAVATSHVFYATGAVQDIGEISRLAHAQGALTIIDGYHAVGVLPIDVRAVDADFYVGGTLKWVCGGPGLTFVYASPAVLGSNLVPESPGWFASSDQFAFETTCFRPAPDAGRFQLGTPAVATVYSGIPALRTILEAGPERINERLRRLTQRIIDAALQAGLDIASPLDATERGGIVMIRIADPAGVVEDLAARSIVIDSRPGKVRLSPHFFNLQSDGDAAMKLLTAFAT